MNGRSWVALIEDLTHYREWGGASNGAGEAYSNGMSLRRTVGFAVMALLVASVALPAMCGACMDLAPRPGCGEKHDAGASAIEQHSMRDGHCGDCGDQPGIAAKRAQYVSLSGVMFFDCARRICVPAGGQNATIYRGGVTARRLVGDRTTSGASAEIGCAAMRSVHLNVFGSGKRSSGNSAYQPLSVSLKI
jgi:hypothetical protein